MVKIIKLNFLGKFLNILNITLITKFEEEYEK